MTLLLTLFAFIFQAAPLPEAASVDEVLSALERRGDDLRTLTADVELTEADALDGSGFTRRGRLWLDDAAGGPALRVRFEDRVEGRKLKAHVLDYLLIGNVLHEHDYQKRAATERRLAPPGERIDLFKLGEGPFPLPIGQSADEVRAAFEVEPLPPGGGPDGTVGLLLLPRPGSPLADDVIEIEMWVGLDDALPRKVVTLSIDETLERTTLLKDVTVNEPIQPDRLTLPPVPAGWARFVE